MIFNYTGEVEGKRLIHTLKYTGDWASCNDAASIAYIRK